MEIDSLTLASTKSAMSQTCLDTSSFLLKNCETSTTLLVDSAKVLTISLKQARKEANEEEVEDLLNSSLNNVSVSLIACC